jgi:hypothetical protein
MFILIKTLKEIYKIIISYFLTNMENARLNETNNT